MGTRDCSSKKRHASISDAQTHADALMGRLAMVKAPIVAFYCDRHSAYHVGHDRRLPASVARTRAATSWLRYDLARKIDDLKRECALLTLVAEISEGDGHGG